MESLIKGVLLGCVLALLVGPVFFMIINTSLKKGFLPASMLAVGVFLSDLLFVLFTYFGSSFLFVLEKHQKVVGLAGGTLILFFGIFTFVRKATIPVDALEIVDDSKTRLVDVAKGFMMNTLNPSALLFWLGVAGTVSMDVNFKGLHAFLFYAGTLGVVLSTDLGKAWIAARIKGAVHTGVLIWMNRISGVALCVFGLYMLAGFFTNWL